MKRKMLFCLAVLLVAGLLLSGCGTSNDATITDEPSVEQEESQEASSEASQEASTAASPEASSDPSPAASPEAPTTAKPEASPAASPAAGQEATAKSGDDVSAIFAKAATISSMSFDFTVTSDEGKMTGKACVKGTKMKTETTVEGEKMIYIYDSKSGDVITYFPEQNMAMKTNFSKEMGGLIQIPAEYSDNTASEDIKTVGKETIDGLSCIVLNIVDKENKEEYKMWVSEKYGIPVRVESTDENGKSVIEYKNIKVGSVQDSEFELPKGVEITSM